MNNKFFVSFDAARLLKEKGYNEETIYYYNSAGKLYLGNGHFNYNAYAVNLSAPTKSEAIDWLERKGIAIELLILDDEWSYIINQKIKSKLQKYEYDSWIDDDIIFKTRLEAEEAAIIKALELLKGKEE